MRSNTARRFSLVGAALLAVIGSAQAGTLVYTPTNPTFGGNPLNGSALLGSAQAQNQFTQSGSSGSGGVGGTPTPGQIFAQQLQSQLYSSLANQITQQIFGSSAATNGTFTFGGTTITYSKNANGTIDVTINDGQTITHVEIPSPPTTTP